MKILQMPIRSQIALLVFSTLLSLGMLIQVLPSFEAMKSTSFIGAVLVMVGANVVNFLLGRVNVPKVQDNFEQIKEVDKP